MWGIWQYALNWQFYPALTINLSVNHIIFLSLYQPWNITHFGLCTYIQKFKEVYDLFNSSQNLVYAAGNVTIATITKNISNAAAYSDLAHRSSSKEAQHMEAHTVTWK